MEAGNVEAAMGLFQRVLQDHPDSLDCRMALETKADLERKQGNPVVAERLYRELLERWPDLNATTGMANVSLAELLLERGGRGPAEEALHQLQAALARPGGVTLNANLFRWHVALVRAAEAIEDMETAKRVARTALELIERGPQFARHPTVGVVKTDTQTTNWLRQRAK